jgi:hypothetical protein
MAHFAEISEDNVVLRVLVVPDHQEHRGEEFLANDLKLGGRWVQTSYNSNIRGNFAAVGSHYDEVKDIFIEPKVYDSWVLGDDGKWHPPVPMPEGEPWMWDEDLLKWRHPGDNSHLAGYDVE